MSRQTLMETLKGGILLMILLLVLLLVGGGFISWKYSTRPRGPEVKVTVNVPEQSRSTATSNRNAPDPAWAGGDFPIPDGIIEKAAVSATPPALESIDPSIAKAIGDAAPLRVLCRTVARESAPDDTVEVCGIWFKAPWGAQIAFGRLATSPATMRLADGASGSVHTKGFHIVKGDRYFRINRLNDSQDARGVAMAFIDLISKAGLGNWPDPFAGLLPDENRVQGSQRLRSGADVGLPFLGSVVAAEYDAPEMKMKVFVKRCSTTDEAIELLKQTADSMRARGGVFQPGAGPGYGVQVFQAGETLEMFSTIDTTLFGITSIRNIGAGTELALRIIRLLSGS